MGLDELRGYYREMNADELRKQLDIDVFLMNVTGKFDIKYAIKLRVAEEEKILDKSETDNYKIKGFDAVYNGRKLKKIK